MKPFFFARELLESIEKFTSGESVDGTIGSTFGGGSSSDAFYETDKSKSLIFTKKA
jgi:hypothetical protein